ncbi:mitochondrial distribution and morphology protein 10 [Rhypophila sp. PSN 637]
MREFMHYITNAFYGATGWNDDNTYKELNTTARELIDFPLPRGLRLTLSSLATPHFATSYQLGSVDIVDGSISYLYTSVPLKNIAAKSETIPLPALLQSFRRLHDLGSRAQPCRLPTDTVHASVIPLTPTTPGSQTAVLPIPTETSKVGSSLLYGRLYLPQSLLEGLIIKRVSPALQVQLSAVSDQSLRNGGTMLGLVQYDKGKYGIEGLASTDGGLLGIRGLYNFGGDTSSSAIAPPLGGATSDTNGERERIYGRFSAGGELYYGTLNKSGGVSLGGRFSTLPAHKGSPLTAALTINPLMGNISATYAVLAKDYCSLATRMEFNVYSYESEWSVGMELWSNRRPAGFLLGAAPPPPRPRERSFEEKLAWIPVGGSDTDKVTRDFAQPGLPEAKEDKYLGVLKARLDQRLRIGLLWEGRAKSLIFTLGTGIDLHKLGEPFRSLGLEVQYSS